MRCPVATSTTSTRQRRRRGRGRRRARSRRRPPQRTRRPAPARGWDAARRARSGRSRCGRPDRGRRSIGRRGRRVGEDEADTLGRDRREAGRRRCPGRRGGTPCPGSLPEAMIRRPSGKPRRPLAVRLPVFGSVFGSPGPGREEHELASPSSAMRERPPAVGREARPRFPSPMRTAGDAVERSQVDACGGEVLLVEEDRLAVGRDVDWERPVEPRQVARGVVARRPRRRSRAARCSARRRTRPSRAMSWMPPFGERPDRAGVFPRERRRLDAALPARPDLVALAATRRCAVKPGTGPFEPHLPVRVDDLEDAVVVAALRVVDEGDEASVRRDADAADPARGFVQDLPDRVLEAARGCPTARLTARLCAVGRPVGVLDALRGSRAALRRPSGTRASVPVVSKPNDVAAVERDRELAGRGDRRGRPRRGGPSERDSVLSARVEKISSGRPLPGGAVDDRLAVGSEPRRADRPRANVSRWNSDGAGRLPAREVAQQEAERRSRASERERSPAASQPRRRAFARLGGLEPSGERKSPRGGRAGSSGRARGPCVEA